MTQPIPRFGRSPQNSVTRLLYPAAKGKLVTRAIFTMNV